MNGQVKKEQHEWKPLLKGDRGIRRRLGDGFWKGDTGMRRR